MNEPLTLEQLRETDGKPVWVKLIEPTQGQREGWVIVYKNNGYAAVQRWTTWVLWYKDYGKTWIAYAYPPAHIDREEWAAKWVNSMPVLGAGDLETRCASCGNLVLFETPFCPYCGKAMTEEAWEELEKRVRGEKQCF